MVIVRRNGENAIGVAVEGVKMNLRELHDLPTIPYVGRKSRVLQEIF